MATAKPSPGSRVIKRYDNRKLYDPADGRYVTLEDVAALVTMGEDVQVLDQKTGEDLTTLTFAQVILELVKDRTALVPRQVLVHLIRLASGPRAGWATWTGPQEAAVRAREEAEKIVGGLLSRGRLTLEEALALRQDISQSVHRLVAEAQEGVESRIHGLLAKGRASGVHPSLDGLKGRLQSLETYLDRPGAGPTRRKARR